MKEPVKKERVVVESREPLDAVLEVHRRNLDNWFQIWNAQVTERMSSKPFKPERQRTKKRA